MGPPSRDSGRVGTDSYFGLGSSRGRKVMDITTPEQKSCSWPPKAAKILHIVRIHYFETLGPWKVLLTVTVQTAPRRQVLASAPFSFSLSCMDTCTAHFSYSSGTYLDCCNVTSEHFPTCVSICLEKNSNLWLAFQEGYRMVQGH